MVIIMGPKTLFQLLTRYSTGSAKSVAVLSGCIKRLWKGMKRFHDGCRSVVLQKVEPGLYKGRLTIGGVVTAAAGFRVLQTSFRLYF